MNYLHLLIVLALAINIGNVECARRVKSFSWNSCGTDDATIIVDSVSIEPDPIHIPGNITINTQITLLEELDSPTTVSFLFQHKPVDSDEWTDIPCVENLGSCYYDDICPILDELRPPDEPCPPLFADNNVPCRCPYAAGTYTITNGVEAFPEPSGLDDGDYHLHSEISKDTRQLSCYDLYVTLYTD